MQTVDRFLDLQLLSLELGDQPVIGEGPGHFCLNLFFKAGVLVLESADMRRFHAFSSFGESPRQTSAPRHPEVDDDAAKRHSTVPVSS